MDYEQLRKLAAEATPGPWDYQPGDWTCEGHRDDEGRCYHHQAAQYQECNDGFWAPGPDVNGLAKLPTGDDMDTWHFSPEDATFIAASREAVPALLDERDRLAAELAEAREAIKQVDGNVTAWREGTRRAWLDLPAVQRVMGEAQGV